MTASAQDKDHLYPNQDQATPAGLFFNRRQFLKASLSAGAVLATAGRCAPPPDQKAASQSDILKIPFERADVFPAKRNTKYKLPEGVSTVVTPRLTAAGHNNFYEFLSGKGGEVYRYVDDFVVKGWKVAVTGACHNPMELGLDDLFSFAHEERLYHFRCVERWAMNVPWTGFPLAELIKQAKPKPNAKYVKFVSANKPSQMPGIRNSSWYEWPYREALRLDEALNELSFMVTGVYGAPLPKQHGSPLRLIVPWKYGFKCPKSIVRIEFLEEQPQTFWMIQPHEYGFISNVNPFIPHPRWSQARSYWLGGEDWFPTPIFNGYEAFVGGLYPDEPRTLQKPLRRGQVAR